MPELCVLSRKVPHRLLRWTCIQGLRHAIGMLALTRKSSGAEFLQAQEMPADLLLSA
jgi:hypothetical protein